MKTLKVVGIIALIVWMTFITLEIEHTKNIAAEACGFALAAVRVDSGPRPDPRSLPFGCPELPD
jgi:hypothetical protein